MPPTWHVAAFFAVSVLSQVASGDLISDLNGQGFRVVVKGDADYAKDSAPCTLCRPRAAARVRTEEMIVSQPALHFCARSYHLPKQCARYLDDPQGGPTVRRDSHRAQRRGTLTISFTCLPPLVSLERTKKCLTNPTAQLHCEWSWRQEWSHRR